MRSQILKLAVAPIAAASVAMLFTAEAKANPHIFANPTGFNAQASGLSVYDFTGTGDLGISVPVLGSSITLGSTGVNFGEPGTSNPPWTGGVRDMFKIEYSGSRTGDSVELAVLDFSFANPLSTQSYMVISDFDSYEGLAIAAYDLTNTLIPYANFSLTRLDGETPGGSTSTTPTWTDTNPTIGWGGGDNASWGGASAVSGFLQDTTNSSTNDIAVALQANTDISRVTFYYNAESISGTGANTLKFNFAAPDPAQAGGSAEVPGPLPVLGIFAAYGFSRKLRLRINNARSPQPSSGSC